jgi:hypothetical protein
LNSIHNAVLKFKNHITEVAAFIVHTLIAPALAFFHGPADHFGRNGSNFLGYRLLKTFQSLGTMFLYLGFEVAPEDKKNSTGSNLANDEMCGLLQNLVETTHFLLHVHRKDPPI